MAAVAVSDLYKKVNFLKFKMTARVVFATGRGLRLACRL